MILTYRYRLLPSKSQHRALERIVESQRQLFNAALEERIDAYKKAGVTRTYFDQCKGLTEWRHSDAEARTLPPNLQRATLKRVDDAYKAFFRRAKAGGIPGFPRFRGKGRFDSFGFREFCAIRFENGRIRFGGLPGALRVHVHRPIAAGASIRSCLFRRDARGWTVAFAVRVDAATPRSNTRVVGIDLGVSMFAALSDGGFIPSLKAARRADRRMRLSHRALSRKRPASRGRARARREFAKCHAKVVESRDNFLHQASARLIRDYDVIVVEALNIKSLAGGYLAKSIRDAAWGKFLSMLRYKAECAGVRIIEVEAVQTSQECCDCGAMVEKPLGERMHVCPNCGLTIDRDLNAARNILNRAGVGPCLHNADRIGVRAGDKPQPCCSG